MTEGPAIPTTESGAEFLIVDNSHEYWKVGHFLRQWIDSAKHLDVATGTFEIGSLLDLDSHWQHASLIRILMGGEVTPRTKRALLAGLAANLNDSLEREKHHNDFLHGVPAIVAAVASGQITCRAYTKGKFHAKAYITSGAEDGAGALALVGSSNFTRPGLNLNVELNLQVRDQAQSLQSWYDRYWHDAEDVSTDILTILTRHTRDYPPFIVFAKALHEYFRHHEAAVSTWEQHESLMFPVLDEYQRDGYRALLQIAHQYRGAFLCDGVGLGKTYIALMVIERLLHERKRVVLLVPKAARRPVWERAFDRYLPHLRGDFSNLVILNHTDLLRGGDYAHRLARVKGYADAIVIDEAHHFRNPGSAGTAAHGMSRYRKLFELVGEKQLYLLTATPINNGLIDLQHMIELFSRRDDSYFRAAPLGIHSIGGHFRRMEVELEARQRAVDAGAEVDQTEAAQVLSDDTLFRELVVQRSRAYVKASQVTLAREAVLFPHREDPHLVPYSITRTYGRLLGQVEAAFSRQKPLFSLAVYFPLAYYRGPDASVDPFQENRQRQVVGLIRTLFLKRFESSAYAFQTSCQTLLAKLLAFVQKNSTTLEEVARLERWKAQRTDLLRWAASSGLQEGGDDEEEDDLVGSDLLEAAIELSRDDYSVEEILAETYLDLDQLVAFLGELRHLEPSQDDKLVALGKLLRSGQVAAHAKVLIFTEFMATARYLKRRLGDLGFKHVDEVDSLDKRDRGEIVTQFAPYYNGTSNDALRLEHREPTQILIATDVLSEGLNLQDATRLINYDIHWNPVRLMQRIGRVDRRLDATIEARIIADDPGQAGTRGTIAYWNFLPPAEVDRLLKLYQKVSGKALRISKTFGIEGRKLLRPEDDFDALRDFNHAYEGAPTLLEELHLEYQRLMRETPDLDTHLDQLPLRVFSGKRGDGRPRLFLCYNLPTPAAPGESRVDDGGGGWTPERGYTKWYLVDLSSQQISEDPAVMIDLVRSTPTTARETTLTEDELISARRLTERYIKNTYLRSVQAPLGVQPALQAWMELN
ncbi:MAG: helicase-related protein [Candidatus Dormibacteria bacterium]